MDKTCTICNKNFISTTKLTVCSDDCRKARNRKRNREWGAANKDKVLAMNRATQAKRIANGKFGAYQAARRSSKAGYLDRFLERARMVHPTTDLTRAYIEEKFGTVCAVTGVPFSFDRKNGTGFQNPYAPSIDRIDSAMPYQIGNIQIVLTAVNFAKSEMSMTDFIRVWKDITTSWAALTQGAY